MIVKLSPDYKFVCERCSKEILPERYYEQGKIDYFTLCEVIYNLVIAKVKKKYTEEPSV